MENERFISLDAVVKKLKDEIQDCKPVEESDGFFTAYKKRVIPKLLQDVINYLENQPTVDAYTEEQVDSIIQKADLLEIENRNLEQEVDWLKNCLNCEIRNKCPRHCGKVVHGCDHWIDGDPMVHGHWVIIPDDYFDLVEMKCSVCGESWGFEEYEDCIPQNYHYCPNCGAHMMDGDGHG